MRLVLDQRLDGRVLDLFGRFEVGFAAVERMHLKTLGAHPHHLVANLHNVGESYLVQSLCQPDSALLCRHRFDFLSDSVGIAHGLLFQNTRCAIQANYGL